MLRIAIACSAAVLVFLACGPASWGYDTSDGGFGHDGGWVQTGDDAGTGPGGGGGGGETDGGDTDGGSGLPDDGGTAGSNCVSAGQCEDGNLCTIDQCLDGTCAHDAGTGTCSVGLNSGCCATGVCCVGPQCGC